MTSSTVDTKLHEKRNCSSVEGIAASATAIQANLVQSQVQTAVAKKQLDAVKQQGEAAVQLIQQATNLGKQLDVRA